MNTEHVDLDGSDCEAIGKGENESEDLAYGNADWYVQRPQWPSFPNNTRPKRSVRFRW